MSFPKYPAYKDSGLKWIGEVPTGWNLSQLSFVFENISSGTTPSTNDDEYYRGNIPWVTTGELREAEIFSTEKNISSEALNVFSALKIYPPGTLLVAMYGATTGRLGWLGVDATTNQACCALAYPKNVHFKFIFYSLLNAKEALLLLSSGGGQPNINQEKIRSFRIPIPPLSEQLAIASFLDRECGKIDALIAEQERLIALLAEKRQAVISHAVTKGLNPNAPMKDSGIPWIGMVPEGWEVVPLSKGILFQRGHDLPKDSRRFGDIPVVSSSGIIDFHNEVKCNHPTIVTGRYGTIGNFHIVYSSSWPLNTSLYAIKIYKNNIKYMYYVLNSIKNIIVSESEKSAVPGIDRNDIHKIYICIPDADVQNDIVKYLDAVLENQEKFRELSLKAITLLKERRAALISAAVTGKIDVRAQSKAIAA